jgi:transposase
MQVRATTLRRGNKTYQYAQLVESYRRQSDGLPLHRVVANLGRITDPVQLENLKAAFAANRTGQRLEPVVAQTARLRRPQATLRYLDVAVVVEMMRTLGLTEELARLLPKEQSDVAPDRIVTALVAQRCLDPQSKLHAVRWFPRTALPELLGVSPAQFNNTRVHRMLEQLESSEQELMRALSRRAHEQHGRFATMFLDLTDTWFVGDGPQLARRGKVKEGMVKKKIGIVLLCNEEGHPLRWQVVQGATAEAPAMLQTMRTVQQVPWLEKIPVVCDRAMGRSAYIREMLDADIRFVTSLIRPEFDSYGVKLPSETLLDLAVARSHDELGACAKQATERARKTALQQLSNNLFYTDLGVVECPVDETQVQGTPVSCSEAMRLAHCLVESVACRKFATHAAAARSMGLSAEQGHRYRNLTKLDADQQEQVLSGQVEQHTFNRLLEVANLEDDEQRRARFAELTEQAASPRDVKLSVTSSRASARNQRSAPSRPRRVRCVAYFNPEIFVRQRWIADTKVRELGSLVERLNERLANPRCRLTTKGAVRTVEDKLRHHDLLDAFEIEVESGTCAKLSLTRNEVQWQRRRSFDGFTVLVAHTSVDASAAELCRTYRAKNAVETDFHVIKSLVKLRPVWHRTDAKVRAHVALCMLALYVQRELTLKLAKDNISAELALEHLETCHVNLYAGRGMGTDAYVVPLPSREQTRVLKRLGLTRLVDQREVGLALRPRSEFVPTGPQEGA